ncbi:unnamed protein product [Calypogeia fissa]
MLLTTVRAPGLALSIKSVERPIVHLCKARASTQLGSFARDRSTFPRFVEVGSAAACASKGNANFAAKRIPFRSCIGFWTEKEGRFGRGRGSKLCIMASGNTQQRSFGRDAEGQSDPASDAPKFNKPRSVVKKVLSVEQAEGEGARVRRSIGRPELKNLDPFLMLDYFQAKPPAGFPDHPHRGFETVTYVLEGAFSHQDFAGHRGIIGPGDLQWMTAGKGIVHSEMPATKGLQRGLQLWVNLPKSHKMVEPNYQELVSKDIPKVEKDGVKVVVIAGESHGIKSPVYTITPIMYLDFYLEPGAEVHQAIPEGWNAFLYILEGSLTVGTKDSTPIAAHHTVQLGPGDGLSVWNYNKAKAQFVLVGGEPINEPVAQYGPFVMNTQEELRQAMFDYQTGRNGFEKARTWRSTPVKLVDHV